MPQNSYDINLLIEIWNNRKPWIGDNLNVWNNLISWRQTYYSFLTLRNLNSDTNYIKSIQVNMTFWLFCYINMQHLIFIYFILLPFL